MTTYLLEWTISLTVLLGAYKLGLEKQAMHQLKRVYLLGTLLVSLLIPLVIVEVKPDTLPFESPTTRLYGEAVDQSLTEPVLVHRLESERPIAALSARDPWSLGFLVAGLYGTITALMLLRFGRNLYQLGRQIRRCPTQAINGATLVRLPGEGLPYTFLHYLFLSDAAYRRGEVEPELFTHELAHIRQRHSIDVLLVEIVLCFGWFNPLLYWLKQAMQLNHEFLADEAVNRTHQNVTGYQYLLLDKLTTAVSPLALTSTLTFQTTKQRLLMMTKQSSTARRWLAAGATLSLFGALTTVMTVQTVAQQVPASRPASQKNTPAPPAGQPMTPDELERRFGDKKVKLPGQAPVLYRNLTPEQKKWVHYMPTPPRLEPTEAQWNDWKNTKKYGLWVDGKRRRDNPLDVQYKRTDIVYFWSSYVHKNARQPEGYLYQLELYTEPEYQRMLKREQEDPFLILQEVKPAPKKVSR